MTLRATTETKFLLKYLLIGLGCLAFFLWSTYDAFIGYPSMLPRAQAWEKLMEDPSLDETERQARWEAMSEEGGWSSKRPKEKETLASVQQTIIYNYAFMAIGIAIAGPCIGWYLTNRGTWIESTDDGLRNSAGQFFTIDQVQQIDKRRWDKKGIAVVHFRDDQQKDQTFIIDDLKYQREETDQILDWLEQQLPREKIVNGQTEAELRAARDDSADAQNEDTDTTD